jgi:hypothetical protein
MTFVERINAISRLVIIIGATTAAVFQSTIPIAVMAITLLVIAIHYYSVSQATDENYVTLSQIAPKPSRLCNTNICDPPKLVIPCRGYKSDNFGLAGPPNPKTAIAPVIAAPSHDASWEDPMHARSSINTRARDLVGLSGYAVKHAPPTPPPTPSFAFPPTNPIYTDLIDPSIAIETTHPEPAVWNRGITYADDEWDEVVKYAQPSDSPRLGPIGISDPFGQEEVYDPRLTGYGTSYRSYLEPMTGQTRFFYKDVDTIRHGNMLQRSRVDYCPSNIAAPECSDWTLRNQEFVDRTQAHRTDLQERLMHKYNTQIGWQRRMAPINRNGTCGAMKRI